MRVNTATNLLIWVSQIWILGFSQLPSHDKQIVGTPVSSLGIRNLDTLGQMFCFQPLLDVKDFETATTSTSSKQFPPSFETMVLLNGG